MMNIKKHMSPLEYIKQYRRGGRTSLFQYGNQVDPYGGLGPNMPPSPLDLQDLNGNGIPDYLDNSQNFVFNPPSNTLNPIVTNNNNKDNSNNDSNNDSDNNSNNDLDNDNNESNENITDDGIILDKGELQCQMCDDGYPVNVAPVNGACPEGSIPDDGKTNPCNTEKVEYPYDEGDTDITKTERGAPGWHTPDPYDVGPYGKPGDLYHLIGTIHGMGTDLGLWNPGFRGEDETTTTTTPGATEEQIEEQKETQEEVVCQKCDEGYPVNIASVDGKCPEGSVPDDGTNPCTGEKKDTEENVNNKNESDNNNKKNNPNDNILNEDESALTPAENISQYNQEMEDLWNDPQGDSMFWTDEMRQRHRDRHFNEDGTPKTQEEKDAEAAIRLEESRKGMYQDPEDGQWYSNHPAMYDENDKLLPQYQYEGWDDLSEQMYGGSIPYLQSGGPPEPSRAASYLKQGFNYIKDKTKEHVIDPVADEYNKAVDLKGWAKGEQGMFPDFYGESTYDTVERAEKFGDKLSQAPGHLGKVGNIIESGSQALQANEHRNRGEKEIANDMMRDARNSALNIFKPPGTDALLALNEKYGVTDYIASNLPSGDQFNQNIRNRQIAEEKQSGGTTSESEYEQQQRQWQFANQQDNMDFQGPNTNYMGAMNANPNATNQPMIGPQLPDQQPTIDMDADQDGLPIGVDATPDGDAGENFNPQPPEGEDGDIACQKCEGGYPVNVAPVNGECPEGSSPDDGSNPCEGQEQPAKDEQTETGEESTEESTEKKKEEDKEGRPFKPFKAAIKAAEFVNAWSRNRADKKAKRLAMRKTSADYVFGDQATDATNRGQYDVNTGIQQPDKQVYARQGKYGRELPRAQYGNISATQGMKQVDGQWVHDAEAEQPVAFSDEAPEMMNQNQLDEQNDWRTSSAAFSHAYTPKHATEPVYIDKDNNIMPNEKENMSHEQKVADQDLWWQRGSMNPLGYLNMYDDTTTRLTAVADGMDTISKVPMPVLSQMAGGLGGAARTTAGVIEGDNKMIGEGIMNMGFAGIPGGKNIQTTADAAQFTGKHITKKVANESLKEVAESGRYGKELPRASMGLEYFKNNYPGFDQLSHDEQQQLLKQFSNSYTPQTQRSGAYSDAYNRVQEYKDQQRTSGYNPVIDELPSWLRKTREGYGRVIIDDEMERRMRGQLAGGRLDPQTAEEYVRFLSSYRGPAAIDYNLEDYNRFQGYDSDKQSRFNYPGVAYGYKDDLPGRGAWDTVSGDYSPATLSSWLNLAEKVNQPKKYKDLDDEAIIAKTKRDFNRQMRKDVFAYEQELDDAANEYWNQPLAYIPEEEEYEEDPFGPEGYADVDQELMNRLNAGPEETVSIPTKELTEISSISNFELPERKLVVQEPVVEEDDIWARRAAKRAAMFADEPVTTVTQTKEEPSSRDEYAYIPQSQRKDGGEEMDLDPETISQLIALGADIEIL